MAEINPKELALDLETEAVEDTKPVSSFKSVYRKRIIILSILVLIGIIASIFLFQEVHEQLSNNHSAEILQYLSNSNGVRLLVNATGPFVIYGTHQIMTVYAIPSNTDSSDPQFNFLVQFRQEIDLNYTLILHNDKGYYKLTNITDGSTYDDGCLPPRQIPELHNVVQAIVNAQVVDDATDDALNRIQCTDGKPIHAQWSGHDILYCVRKDSTSGDVLIDQIATKHLHCKVSYLTQPQRDALTPIIRIPENLTEPIFGEPITCDPLHIYDKFRTHRRLNAVTYPNNPWFRPSRRLWSDEEAYIVVDEVKLFDVMATNECDYVCKKDEYDAYTALPITDISLTYGGTENDFGRRLEAGQLALPVNEKVVIPKTCVFIAGAGYNNYVNEETYLTDEFVEAWGLVHEVGRRPCYCARVKFVSIDNSAVPWHDFGLMKRTCGALLHAEPSQNYDYVVDNVIVFTHYTAALQLATGLFNTYCELGPTSHWVTIHAPLLGIQEPKPIDRVCSPRLVMVAVWFYLDQSYYGDQWHDYFQESFEEWRTENNFHQGITTTIADVIRNCVDEQEVDYNLDQLTWAGYYRIEDKLKESSLENSRNIIAHYVKAALCGFEHEGLMSTNLHTVKFSEAMGYGGEGTDGMTDVGSCTLLKDLKLQVSGEEIEFGDHNSLYYQAAVSHLDITLHTDSTTNSDSNYRTWLDEIWVAAISEDGSEINNYGS